MAGEKTSVTAGYAKLTVEKLCTIVVNSNLLFVVCIATFSHFCTLCYMPQRICCDKIPEAMYFMIFIILIYLLANIHCTGIVLRTFV